MKKILIGLLLIIGILAAALAVFIATFDLNRYKPVILKQVQAVTGKQVRIGRIALTWKNGLAARVDNLALFDAGDAEPDASLDQILVRLEMAPLLRKEIRIQGIWIMGPRLVVERSAEGIVSVAGIKPPAAEVPGVATKPSPSSAAVGVSFMADVVRIENGNIRFIDHSTVPPLDLTVSDLDAEVKNISLTGPVSFAARAVLFGSKQNIAVGGKVTPPSGGKPATLENFTLQADLGTLDLKQLAASLPSVRSAGLLSARGILEARIERFVFDPTQRATTQARVILKNGAIALSSVPLPLEDVAMEASLQNGNAEVKNFTARFADGTLGFQGTIQDVTGRAVSDFRASARELAVGKLAKIASPSAPRLEGHLSLDFEGRGQGLNAAVLTQTLSGQGRLAMKDGVLTNSNILRTLVQKISQIPGVGESVLSRIPPQYMAKINEPSTILRPFEMPFAVQQGRVFFEQLQLPTDLFVLGGAGSVGFDRSISMQAAIQIDKGLSQILASAAQPVQYLLNPAGQIEVQMTIEGVPPAVRVVPNLDAAITRFATEKGQQLVTDLIQKKDKNEIFGNLLGRPSQESAPQAAQPAVQGGIPLEPAPGEPAQAQPQSQEDQLMNLLANAFKKDDQ